VEKRFLDGVIMRIINSTLKEFKSKKKGTELYVRTAISGVKGSYPEPLDAKHTPVLRS
jgi:hypothetical protein